MSDPKPKKERGRPVVKVRDPDGTLRELPRQPPPSDDPDIVKLWDMPMGRLQKILDDPKHALHEKALTLTTEAFAPLQASLQEWFRSQAAILEPLTKPIDSLTKPIDSLTRPIESLVSEIDTSWLSDILPKYPAWQDLRRSLDQPAQPHPLVVHSIDFNSVTPPDAPLSEVVSAADDAAVFVLRELLEVQREQLAQARADSTSDAEALEVARGSRKAGWWAAGAALLAAVIGIIGIIVTVVNAPK